MRNDGRPGRLIVSISVAASFVLGIVFIFLWSPHPWGWYGIDQYHLLAIDLAEGRGFPTMDVPWGYGYFLSFFYRLFGPTPAPALVAQAALNALIPAVIYQYARKAFDRRVAAVAALLTAFLSFNTVYASTESSDSVCTLLFVLMVAIFATARDRWIKYVLCGALCGLAAQFRPNLILVPALLAVLTVMSGHTHRLRNAVLLVATAALMLAPWTIRNFRLTGQLIPTSTHGGVQLWYGTLQTGLYLDARNYNPRSVFEPAVFPYTSLLDTSILVEGTPSCDLATPAAVQLVYWTDAEPTRRYVPLAHSVDNWYAGSIPPQRERRTIFYYFEVTWTSAQPYPEKRFTPTAGPADPLIYFVSDDHLGDLDLQIVMLDVFDVARLLRHITWGNPLPSAEKLDLDRNGRWDEADVRAAVSTLLSGITDVDEKKRQAVEITPAPDAVRARFADGSELAVPRQWTGLLTDLEIGDGFAAALIHGTSRFTRSQPNPELLGLPCLGMINVSVNRPFYRTQPHEMRRYAALAWDNIRRDPTAFAWSVLYRAVRLFIIRGTEDRNTAVQFRGSRVIYLAASAASAAFFVLFLVGVVLAWRRGWSIVLPVVLIAYVPATIAFVLTNMRYTVTVQPLMFVFVAVSLVAILEGGGLWPRREGSETAPRL